MSSIDNVRWKIFNKNKELLLIFGLSCGYIHLYPDEISKPLIFLSLTV